MDYLRLRAEYDAAFRGLRQADSELRSIQKQHPPDSEAELKARQRFEQAVEVYRACRENLAGYLLMRQPVETPSGPMESRTLGVWTTGLDGRAAMSYDSTNSRPHEVRAVAHRLWEEAGRPTDKAEEHWYRAEEMLRCGH